MRISTIVSNVLLAISCMMFFISFSTIITLHFRGLYYFDIAYLNIESESGFSREEIKENYNAIIDYNSIGSKSKLILPTMPLSPTGSIHFQEVKEIFDKVYIICIFSFMISVLGSIVKWKKKEWLFLKLTSIFNIAIPAILGLLVSLNWDSFFVIFHKLFFSNDYWIFDPKVDPVINILPDVFFMHCAFAIMGIIVVSSGLCYVIYRRKSNMKEG